MDEHMVGEENLEFRSFLQMITLAVSGASGKKVNIAEQIDWPSILVYAQEQAVLPLIGCALLGNPDIPCPEQFRVPLINALREMSASNLVRRQRVIQLLSEMESAGFNIKLVKGYTVAACYVRPEIRDSSDVDILIAKEQEIQVYEFLRSRGFLVAPRGKTEHHAVCRHPKLGKVEIHTQLYNEIVTDVWLGKIDCKEMIAEAAVRAVSDGMSYTTLGYTDHLIFLTLHMAKHFIHSGMGIRMMIDVSQFFVTHQNKIDIVRYWKIMDELSFSKLVNCIFWMMIHTGCFEQSVFPMLRQDCPEEIEWILRDLIAGGHMGVKRNHRIMSSYEYTRLVLRSKKRPWEYRRYMLKHKIRSAHHQMFPDRKQLQILYPVVKKVKILTPFLRIYRMLSYPLKKIYIGVLREQIRSEKTELPLEVKQRIDMFYALDML